MVNEDLLINYQKKWVALTADRSKVIDMAESLNELAIKIKKLKAKDLIVTYVLPMDSYHSPLCSQ